MRYTLDCEFDGHGGPLISMALVPEEGNAYYARTTYTNVQDPWVRENVVPFTSPEVIPLDVRWDQDDEVWIGHYLKDYIMYVQRDMNPTIIADSPVDIWRFCQLVSTGPDGAWRSTSFESMKFEVHNVDCWPNNLGPDAVQHNAYWDALALWEKINAN